MQDVDVANQALALIGQDPIVGLDDDTTISNRVALFFSVERDATLRDHPWNFAIARKTLAVSITAPVAGFAYAYPRDPDDLRILNVNEDKDLKWQVEGRNIVTDESTCVVKYIRRVTNPDEWDATFASAFSLRLASKLALAIAHLPELGRELLNQYLMLLMDAQSIDGQEQGAQDSLYGATLVDVRGL